MGTRGLYGFYRDGITKATYAHWAHPFGLGESILRYVLDRIPERTIRDKLLRRNPKYKELNVVFDKIILVQGNDEPTADQIKQYKGTSDFSVGKQDRIEWYHLLRNLPCELEYYDSDNINHMIDRSDFIKDSLMCEWAYLINLEDNVFEIYKGFQREPQDNRYYTIKSKSKSFDYYNCKLLASIPFEKLKDFEFDDILPKEEY